MSMKRKIGKQKLIAATFAAALFTLNYSDAEAAGSHQDNPESPFSGTISDVNYDGDGGAILFTNTGTLIINDSTFDNNSATGKGGAIYNTSEMEINGSTFTNNTSTNGGAVYNTGTMTLAGGNTFTGNSASSINNDISNEGTINFTGRNSLDGGIRTAGPMGIVNVTSGHTTINNELRGQTVSLTGGELHLAGTGTAGTNTSGSTINVGSGAIINTVDGRRIYYDNSIYLQEGAVAKGDLIISTQQADLFGIASGTHNITYIPNLVGNESANNRYFEVIDPYAYGSVTINGGNPVIVNNSAGVFYKFIQNGAGSTELRGYDVSVIGSGINAAINATSNDRTIVYYNLTTNEIASTENGIINSDFTINGDGTDTGAHSLLVRTSDALAPDSNSILTINNLLFESENDEGVVTNNGGTLNINDSIITNGYIQSNGNLNFNFTKSADLEMVNLYKKTSSGSPAATTTVTAEGEGTNVNFNFIKPGVAAGQDQFIFKGNGNIKLSHQAGAYSISGNIINQTNGGSLEIDGFEITGTGTVTNEETAHMIWTNGTHTSKAVTNDGLFDIQNGTCNLSNEAGISDTAGTGAKGTLNIGDGTNNTILNAVLSEIDPDLSNAYIKQNQINILDKGTLKVDVSKLVTPNAISNDGVLVLSSGGADGTLSSGITGTGYTDVNAGTKTITFADAVTNNVNVLTGTLDNNALITGDIAVSEDAVLYSTAANINGDLTNEGTFNLEGASLMDVLGAGTTILQNNVAAADDYTIAGTLNANGKEIDMADGTNYNTISANVFTPGTNVTLKVDIGMTSAANADKIATTSTTSASTGTINITDINVNDVTTIGSITHQIISNTNDASDLALTLDITSKTGVGTGDISYSDEITADTKWSDTFETHNITGATLDAAFELATTNTDNDSVKTTITRQEGTGTDTPTSLGDTLALVVQDTTNSTKTFTADTDNDYTVGADLGTLGGNQLSIIGTGHTAEILGNNKAGITISNNAQTLNITDVAGMGGFNGAAVDNAAGGTINISGSTLTGTGSDIVNDGEGTKGVFITGTSAIDSISDSAGTGAKGQTTIGNGSGAAESDAATIGTLIQKNVNILSDGKLSIAADNLTAANGVKNDGTITFTGGNVATNISSYSTAATGTVEIDAGSGNTVSLLSANSITDNNLKLTSGTFDATNKADASGNINFPTDGLGLGIIANGGTLTVQDGKEGAINLGNVNTAAAPLNVMIDAQFTNGTIDEQGFLGTADLLNGTITGSNKVAISDIKIMADPVSSGFRAQVADTGIAGKVDVTTTTLTGLSPAAGSILIEYNSTTGFIKGGHETLKDAIISTIPNKLYVVNNNADSDLSTAGDLTLGGTSLSVTANDKLIQGAGNSISLDNNGQTLSFSGGSGVTTIDGFKTFIDNTAGGTVNLNNVTFTNNTEYDVNNAGTLNLTGNIVLDDAGILNAGTTNVNGATVTGKYVQEAAAAETNIFNGSSMTIDGASKITDGTISLGDTASSGSITFNNGVDNEATVTSTGDNSSISLSTASTSLTLKSGSDIDKETAITIAADTTLNASGTSIKGGGSEGITNDGTFNLTNDGTTAGTLARAINNATGDGSTGTVNLTGTTNSTSAGTINQANIKVDDGTFTMGADITANTLLEVTDDGIIANAEKEINAKALNNEGEISGGGNLKVGDGASTSSGTITQNNISLAENGTFENTGTMTSNDTFTNNATVTGDTGTLNVNNGTSNGAITQAIVTVAGEFTNDAALTANTKLTVYADGELTNNDTITAAAIENYGDIDNKDTINADDVLNAGDIINDGTVTVTNQIINGTGSTITNNKDITTGSLLNYGEYTNTNENTTLTADDIENHGNITNKGTAAIANAIVNASDGTVTNEKTITAKVIENYNDITNKAGADITAETIQNYANGDIVNNGEMESTVFLANEGTITGTGNLTAKDGSNTNEITQKDITLANGTFDNTGTMTSTGTFSNNDTITGDTGTLNVNNGVSNGAITQAVVTVAGEFENNAALTANTNLTVYSDGKVTNNDAITAALLDNYGEVDNAENSTIDADTITNSGDINNDGTITVSDKIVSGTGATITNNKDITTGSLINYGDYTNTDENTTLTADNVENHGDITNKGTTTVSNSIVNAPDGTVTNEKTLTAKTIENYNNITNKAGADITAETIQNYADAEIANNGTVTSTDYFANAGKVTGNGDLYVTNGYNANSIEQELMEVTAGEFENKDGANINVTTFNNDAGATVNNDNGGTITVNDTLTNDGTFNNDGDVYALVLNNNDTFVNDNDGNVIVTTTITNAAGAKFDNAGDVSANDIVNDGTVNNSFGGNIIAANNISNTNEFNTDGNVKANTVDNSGTFTNTDNGVVNVADTFSNTNQVNNSGNINTNTFANAAGATLTNDGIVNAIENFNNDGVVNNNAEGKGILNVKNGYSNDAITQGIVSIAGDNTAFDNNAQMNVEQMLDNDGTLNNTSDINVANSEKDATLDNSGVINTDADSTITANRLVNTDGTINMTKAKLTVTDQNQDILGTVNVKGSDVANDVSEMAIAGTNPVFKGELNVGNLADSSVKSTLKFLAGDIDDEATVNIAKGNVLNVVEDTSKGEEAYVVLNENDTFKGDVVLDDGTVEMKNVSYTTGDKSTTEGGKLPYYEQNGGNLALTNSTLTMKDSSKISDGNMFVDSTSTFNSEKNGFNVDTLANGGLVNAINGDYEHYGVNTLLAGDGGKDKQGDFNIDIYARSNDNKKYDDFGSSSSKITAANGKSGVINISDWSLNGDLNGHDAPIDRSIELDVFKGSASKVHFTATDKEVFTPLGWYRLNNSSGKSGKYSLDLVRINPQAYRGQITTLAQWQNQLTIDDLLFTHSMVLPGIKDNEYGMSYSSMANKFASTDPAYAPYQYSRKDGGLWYKAYGNFEKLEMTRNIGKVGNNAYGSLIGADFGLKELRNGWKFMPTAYIGYNGAHQHFHGNSAYQNGGQIGMMGTWYKNNFMVGALAYGGLYDNIINLPNGNVDRTFNYFAGASSKASYNIKLHKDFAIQPNLFFAYNFFGQQNFHTDYGQMGMMSGTLNGVNLAPGVNLIWEKETFSIYGTVQYMYNLNGAVGGRGGNVDMPRLAMERGYIQYGLGATKKFTNRASGYVQSVFRNVGRTGVGFQAGFQYKIGKDYSNMPTKKTYIKPKNTQNNPQQNKTTVIKRKNQISLLKPQNDSFQYIKVYKMA